MNRRWLFALALAGSLTACGISPEDQPRDTTAPQGPFHALSTAGPVEPDITAGPALERLYFVRQSRLVAAVRHVPDVPSAEQLLATLRAGPTNVEQTAVLSSTLSGSPTVVSVHVQDNRAIVELTAPVEGAGRADEILLYAQIVCTLTDRAGIAGVTFARGAQPIAVPRGDGSLSPEPLNIADYATLIAAT